MGSPNRVYESLDVQLYEAGKPLVRTATSNGVGSLLPLASFFSMETVQWQKAPDPVPSTTRAEPAATQPPNNQTAPIHPIRENPRPIRRLRSRRISLANLGVLGR